MGETPRDRNMLAESDISFRVVITVPHTKEFSIKYGPYTGWVHAIFDVGQAIGYAQGRGTPAKYIRVEWFIGDKLIETRELSDEPGQGTGRFEDSGGGQDEATGA